MLGMITINLLPPELRKTETTPLSRFIVLIAGIVILCVVFCVWFYYHNFVLLTAEKDLAEKKIELESVREIHKQYEALVKLQGQYAKRGETIESIRNGRILWGIKLMRFYDVFTMEPFRETAWIDDLSMTIQEQRQTRRPTRGQAATAAPIGTFTFKLNTAGEPAETTINFRKTLQGLYGSGSDLQNGVKFWKDFLEINPPKNDLEESADTEPDVFRTDKVELKIKKPEDPNAKKRPARGRR